MTDTGAQAAIDDALARIEAHSPFLSMVARREQALAAKLSDALSDPIAAADIGSGDMPIAQALRVARRRLALMVAVGDLSGRYDLERVTGV